MCRHVPLPEQEGTCGLGLILERKKGRGRGPLPEMERRRGINPVLEQEGGRDFHPSWS